MTDCNDNQLVVKVQIEHHRAAAQDQQVATADQLATQHAAPDAPSVTTDKPVCPQDPAGMRTPAEDQPATAPSPSLEAAMPDASNEVTVSTNESDNPTSTDLDPQTLAAGATLSDLDRIGLGTRIIRTTRASGTTREGEQPSTSGVVDSQPASTSQGHQDLFGDTDMSGLDILDMDVDGLEDFSDIDPEMVDELLGGGPEEMIKNWVDGCNRGMTAEQGPRTQPELENELESLDLANEAMGHAIPSADCAEAVPGSPVITCHVPAPAALCSVL